MNLVICEKCGKIYDYNKINIDELLKREIKCECEFVLSIENWYPKLQAQDFVLSANVLYEKAKECDKKNLESVYGVICNENIMHIDKSKLDAYVNKYEKIEEKYPNNNPDYFITIFDEFEDYLKTKEDIHITDIICSCIRVHCINKFRKPFVIITMSLIEQLFNEYFIKVVENKFSSYGADNFLKIYETAGIHNCIKVLDSFFDEPLKDKMNKIEPGYFEKWDSYRKLRNDIIHSNSKFISKVKLADVNNFINTSIRVFAELTSQCIRFKII